MIESKKIHKAEIIRTERVAKATYYAEFAFEKPINAKPGQFISIYCGMTLRRPFSVYSNGHGRIGILYKKRGRGTEFLSKLRRGETVNISGPFGNGFEIREKKSSLLIGAGIGIAPIAFIKQKIDETGTESFFIAGFQTENDIPSNIHTDETYTDDGSFGIKGNVLSCIDSLIRECNPKVIYACGPSIVLRKLSAVGQKYGIETQLSLENVMACSIGVCRGCIIKTKKDTKIVNSSVCKDGPVFNGNDIVWESVC